ncbi:hypothetical protein [Kitasatospora cathayae]|uniref:DUF1877 family protein n=1 Tax=Kitasatospora cathayae TaxID=3004092 RepID=A0ABY7QIF8_9ACTN|nr:hypothetical protein [Kitasatospora sp. HUAS 3-15]WBP92035.1 hypothetical protein O1G21_40325 [Kitasatospora sp. HUAS 3-15]
MTLLLDVLLDRRNEAEAGPSGWQPAWDRALDLLAPHLRGWTMTVDGPILADGAAALALALYLLSTGQGPAAVTRGQVEDLLDRRGGTDYDIAPRWEEMLRTAGHDPEDQADPVSTCWRQLRVDNSPPEDASEEHDLDSFRRWGPGYIEGLRHALAPRFEIRF